MDINNLQHFPPLERITNILMNKTQNRNGHFFRILMAYYFCKVAATMQVKLQVDGIGTIPVNMFAFNLAVSGSGKGYSTAIVEQQILNRFKENFLNRTLPTIAKNTLNRIVLNRCAYDPNLEKKAVTSGTLVQYKNLGEYVFSFNSATPAAIQQIRQKIQMSGIGSLNLEIDEIGLKLSGNTDFFPAFLELFDIGHLKNKLTKNTTDNERLEDFNTPTPANMMAFGTPVDIFIPGSKLEELFLSLIKNGYGRRCFFGYSRTVDRLMPKDENELYAMLTDTSSEKEIHDLSMQLGRLADTPNHGAILTMSKDVTMKVLKYRLNCQSRAKKYNEYEEEKKAELEHRYYKSLKLAGAYAFVDNSPEITEAHWLAAVKLAEESGEHFLRILVREQPYEVLAKFIVSRAKPITEIDIQERFGFFKGTKEYKKHLLHQAAIFGYTNNLIIKKELIDGFEFYSGETLEESSPDKSILSYSGDITEGYIPVCGRFESVAQLTQLKGFHYTAHQFNGGYRSSANVKPGFNLVILDMDNGLALSTAQLILKDYQAIFATTKRHTPENNRFRIILPLSHVLRLDSVTYSRFMENVFNWLPIQVDTATKDIARKWETNPGHVVVQKGKLLNALQFIPHTKKEEEHLAKINEFSDLQSLEKWFMINTDNGNRNNQLMKYAFVLLDHKLDLHTIRSKVHTLNKRFDLPLAEEEINNTIMVTIANRLKGAK